MDCKYEKKIMKLKCSENKGPHPTNKHFEMCLTLLAIREIQIKTSLWFFFITIRNKW